MIDLVIIMSSYRKILSNILDYVGEDLGLHEDVLKWRPFHVQFFSSKTVQLWPGKVHKIAI